MIVESYHALKVTDSEGQAFPAMALSQADTERLTAETGITWDKNLLHSAISLTAVVKCLTTKVFVLVPQEIARRAVKVLPLDLSRV